MKRFNTWHNKETDENIDLELAWALEATGKRAGYNNFSAIDWIHDAAKERIRKRLIRKKGPLKIFFDSTLPWLATGMIGIFVGILAAFITISTNWLSQTKLGYCKRGFFVQKTFCCIDSNNEFFIINFDQCNDWVDLIGTGAGGFLLNYLLYISLSTLYAFLSVFIVFRFCRYSAGSGVSEVKTILGGFIIKRFFGFKTLIVKSIGLILSVSSGLSLGKEGPMVHIACCCGNVIIRLFEKYRNNEAKKREILSAASASGIAVAFGSPIGGVLFSLEEVSYYFPSKTMFTSLFCASVAAVILHALDPFGTGKICLFQTQFDVDTWHFVDIFLFMMIGSICGAIGALLTKAMSAIHVLRKNINFYIHPIYEVTLLSFVTSLITFPMPLMRIDSTELLAALFTSCSHSDPLGLCGSSKTNIAVGLFFSAVFKFVLTCLTFGALVPAGVFIPCMAIGACVGRLVGLILDSIYQRAPEMVIFAGCGVRSSCIVPGIYAMIGAASCLTGMTKLTITVAVMMFELTGAVSFVLPTIVGLMMSRLVSDAISKFSITEMCIDLNDYPFLGLNEEYSLSTNASNIMTCVEDMVVIPCYDQNVGSIRACLENNNYHGFVVVEDISDLFVVGFINRREIEYTLENSNDSTPVSFHDSSSNDQQIVDLTHWMDHTPITVNPQSPVELVLELFQKLGLGHVLVVDKGCLRGIITKKDLLVHLKELDINNKK